MLFSTKVSSEKQKFAYCHQIFQIGYRQHVAVDDLLRRGPVSKIHCRSLRHSAKNGHISSTGNKFHSTSNR